MGKRVNAPFGMAHVHCHACGNKLACWLRETLDAHDVLANAEFPDVGCQEF